MKRTSRWGIGPIFAALSIIYGCITIRINQYFSPLFDIGFIRYKILRIFGIIFICIGIPYFIATVITVTKAYNADKLVTGGVFGTCRHPLYSSWVIFIVPGIFLMFNSWICLTTPIFMYIILLVLVKKEEIYLENRFGGEYQNYKNKIPCILPYGIFIK